MTEALTPDPSPDTGRGDSVPILHVVRPASGGIRQHVIELIRRTEAGRFSVSLAAPDEFLVGLPAGLPLRTSEALDIAAQFSPTRDASAARRLAQLVPHPGVVHAHGLRAAFVGALAHPPRPFPFVFTAHNLVPGAGLTRLAVRFIGRRATRVIAISQAVAEGLIASGIPPGKVTVIPNGVDVAYFEEPLPQTSLVGPKGFVVGCVARLSPEKGVDVLLGAAALLPEVTFLIAGEGPQREALEKITQPNVHWLGRVQDTRTVYTRADVMALPSRQEGQGIVALEAMAAGVPVVASRIGGLAEMLTDGATARLVPAGDAGALAAALAALRDDEALRARLVSGGRALVRARYDVRRMVEAVEQVYRTAAAG